MAGPALSAPHSSPCQVHGHSLNMAHVCFFIVVFFSSFEPVRSPQKTSLILVGGLSKAPVEWSLLSSLPARLSWASQAVKHLCVTARHGSTACSIL